MTCIAGVVDGARAFIGGDSLGVAGSSCVARKDEKVFRNGPFLMGFTDSFRMGQLLRYAFTPPERKPDEPVYRFMVTTFVDAVRACLKAGGFAKSENAQESAGSFMVIYQGRLFVVYSDYQVEEAVHEFAALGCGRDVALGALHATRGRPAPERLQAALSAAEEFTNGVRRPFVVLSDDGAGTGRG